MRSGVSGNSREDQSSRDAWRRKAGTAGINPVSGADNAPTNNGAASTKSAVSASGRSDSTRDEPVSGSNAASRASSDTTEVLQQADVIPVEQPAVGDGSWQQRPGSGATGAWQGISAAFTEQVHAGPATATWTSNTKAMQVIRIGLWIRIRDMVLLRESLESCVQYRSESGRAAIGHRALPQLWRMQAPYHGLQIALDATVLLRFNGLKASLSGQWTMTTASPRFETFLLAAQSLGGLGLGAAWLLSGSTSGWPLVALALLIAGGLLAVAAFVALSGSFRVVPSPHADATLVRTGIYRWLRHPMYVAVLLVLAAAACSRPSAWVLLIVGLNFVLYLGKARYEESVLMDHYEGYADYREGTLGVKPLADSSARRQGTPTTNQEQSESPSGPSVRE